MNAKLLLIYIKSIDMKIFHYHGYTEIESYYETDLKWNTFTNNKFENLVYFYKDNNLSYESLFRLLFIQTNK